jgi:aspartate carbamoyltransferase catalytic subunit
METKREFWDKMREQTGLSRVGESWSEFEEQTVLSRIAEGKSPQEISAELQRTASSIQSRLVKIAIEMFERKLSFDDILLITRVSKERVEEAFEKKKTKKYLVEKETKSHQDVPKSEFMELKCLLYDIRELLRSINSK